MLVQLYVSVRDRAQNRDLTGDPWDGRSLEWSIPSPPPAFNFARIPIVDQLDAFAEAKRAGRQLQYEPAGPVDLPVPTIVPFVMGVSAFVLAFAAIWYMSGGCSCSASS
jgi:cytochrome o ubiquinol oxidase subunit 1